MGELLRYTPRQLIALSRLATWREKDEKSESAVLTRLAVWADGSAFEDLLKKLGA